MERFTENDTFLSINNSYHTGNQQQHLSEPRYLSAAVVLTAGLLLPAHFPVPVGAFGWGWGGAFALYLNIAPRLCPLTSSPIMSCNADTKQYFIIHLGERVADYCSACGAIKVFITALITH